MASNERALPYYRQCFVCGEARSGRLGVRFKVVNGMVKGVFIPSEKHVGFPGIVHGGILAALLDEAMAWAVYAQTGLFGLSVEITVRFFKPLPPGRKVEVVGFVLRRKHRFLEVTSEIQGEDAVIYARAWGRFLLAPKETSDQWSEALQGGDKS